MCIVCILTAISSLLMLAPTRSAHQTRKVAAFEALITPYLPDDARGAKACRALGERLQTSPVPFARPNWRAFSRPNEARLMAEAERAADQVFPDARAALLTGGDAGARALGALTDFYAALGTYPGEGGRALKRFGAVAGTSTLPLLLIAAGVYVAQFPELCGAAPGLFGGHAAHVLVGVGVVGLAGLMGLVATPSGGAWFIDVGTAEADQAAGARRAEEHFWRTLVARWNEDPALTQLTAGSPEAVASQVLRRLNGQGRGVLEACEGLLAAPPACAKCAG